MALGGLWAQILHVFFSLGFPICMKRDPGLIQSPSAAPLWIPLSFHIASSIHVVKMDSQHQLPQFTPRGSQGANSEGFRTFVSPKCLQWEREREQGSSQGRWHFWAPVQLQCFRMAPGSPGHSQFFAICEPSCHPSLFYCSKAGITAAKVQAQGGLAF